MRGVMRIFARDLFELLRGLRGIVLVIVFPCVLLLLVGQLPTDAPTFRILVVGAPASAEGGGEWLADLLRMLNGISAFRVTRKPGYVQDPLQELRLGGHDLVLGCTVKDRCLDRESWVLYTGETDLSRLNQMQRLVVGLERALEIPRATKQESDTELLGRRLTAVGAFPPRSLRLYFPQAVDPFLFVLPMTIALVVSFLPFALAVPSLIREREEHTLEILLAAPGIRASVLFVGKCVLPMVLTVLVFLLMLVLCQSLYQVHIKGGLASVVLFLLLSLSASTLLGLAISAAAGSQAQTMLSSALYFLALTLFSGFLFPIPEGSPLIRALSSLLPLTFVQPVLRAWMFGAWPLPAVYQSAGWLLVQVVVYGTLAVLTYRHALRRI